MTVLVAARDADFLRLAAALLTRAGHTVRTSNYRFARVERLMTIERPDVLVLEGGGDHVRRLLARASLLVPPVAVVLVDGEADAPRAGVAKWGPPSDLVRAVEKALGHAGPRLRLVEG